EKGLAMMVSGDPIRADEALQHGLIDAIVGGDLAAAGVAFAEKVLAEQRPLRKIRDLDDKVAAVRGTPEVFANFRKSVARQIRGGTMGGGIAMNFANAGIPVTVVEVAREALDRGLGIVRKNYEATASRGRLTAQDVEKRMGLITGTTDFDAVRDADIVIEAVF